MCSMALPRYIRYPLALPMIALGAANVFLWQFGGLYTNGALIGGEVVLAFAPSQAEKNGYHF